MKRHEYEKKLEEWEAQGYDASELREKWFPPKKSRRGSILKWLAISIVIITLAIVVTGWQLSKTQTQAPALTTAPAPKPALTAASTAEPELASLPAATTETAPTPAPEPALIPEPEPALAFESIDLNQIQSATLSSNNINGSNDPSNQIPQGTILLFKTTEGRYGKLQIKEYGYNLVLRWVTLNSDGATYSKGDNLVVRGTAWCDLDLGVEGATSADFWWQQVNNVKRYLVPKNGAKFSVMPKPATVASYVLSGGPSAIIPIVVDDDFIVEVNGEVIHNDNDGSISTIDPITFEASPDDSIHIVALDYGGAKNLSSLYLNSGGKTYLITYGIPNSASDEPVFFDETFIISELPEVPYVLSGGPSKVIPIYVDDDLFVEVNGEVVFQDNDELISTIDPIAFAASPDDSVHIVALDYGGAKELSNLYLIAEGKPYKITDGVPNSESGEPVFFDKTFKISSLLIKIDAGGNLN